MLKKGFAWHYTAYDQRPELAKVSKLFPRLNFSATIYNARYLKNKCLFSLTVGETSTDWPEGLWASSKPQKPWEWRKDKRNGTA